MIGPGPLFLLQPNFPAFTHRRRMALQPRDPDFTVLARGGGEGRRPAQAKWFGSSIRREFFRLAFLKREPAGTAIWNDWRRSNPRSVPDLLGAKLTGANLRGADLANCCGAAK
jgi:hypothetical protein